MENIDVFSIFSAIKLFGLMSLSKLFSRIGFLQIENKEGVVHLFTNFDHKVSEFFHKFLINRFEINLVLTYDKILTFKL